MSQIRNNTLFEAAAITNLTPYGIFVAHQKWMLVRNSLPHPVPGKAEHWISLGTKNMQWIEQFKGQELGSHWMSPVPLWTKQNQWRALVFIQNDSATSFKYSPYQNITQGYLIEINLGSLIFSNMPLLLFKFGFWSRLPINKWFFPHQQVTSWRQFSMDEGRRDVLTVTDTRTICCLISSRAYTLNLMKSMWYLNSSTLHNSTSSRSLAPWSLSTQTPTSSGVLQH